MSELYLATRLDNITTLLLGGAGCGLSGTRRLNTASGCLCGPGIWAASVSRPAAAVDPSPWRTSADSDPRKADAIPVTGVSGVNATSLAGDRVNVRPKSVSDWCNGSSARSDLNARALEMDRVG